MCPRVSTRGEEAAMCKINVWSRSLGMIEKMLTTLLCFTTHDVCVCVCVCVCVFESFFKLEFGLELAVNYISFLSL